MKKNPKDFKILLGVHDKTKKEPTQYEAMIAEIHVNPAFDHDALNNDITLLKLTTPVPYTANISPVCVANNETEPDCEEGYVTGWGRTREGGSDSKVLMQVVIPVLDQEVCKEEYQSLKPIDDTMMCGGYWSGGKDSCQGDSGGPWVFKDANGTWTQHGIVSWGRGCAEPKFAGVYSRITALREFINKHVDNV